MPAGETIETGTVLGIKYSVWERYDGKKFVYTDHPDGRDRRHNMSWLKKRKKQHTLESK